MKPTDLQLISRYTRDACQDSFTELVNRHLDLVYSAALRQLRSPDLAQEVAQSVFIELSRAAGKIKPGSILPAWLYQVTRRRTIDVVRRESRRQLREQIACENNAMNSPASDWSHIEPLLDEAMDSLDEADRAAILLRYFENKSLREVGEALGASEDAAQKRVSRAIDRLRDYLTRKKIPVAAAGLAAVISANAVEAAPAGLSATVSASALAAGAAAHTAAIIGVTKAIAMTTIQKALIAAVITATVSTGVYEASRAAQLAGKVQTLQQQQQQTSDQNTQSAQALDDANKKLAVLQSENDQLRAQLTNLKAASDELAEMKADDAAAAKDPTQRAMLSWLDRADRLRQHMRQMPNQSIPEMQFLTDQDWLDAARGNLDTDAQYRRAMSTLRSTAKMTLRQNCSPRSGSTWRPIIINSQRISPNCSLTSIRRLIPPFCSATKLPPPPPSPM